MTTTASPSSQGCELHDNHDIAPGDLLTCRECRSFAEPTIDPELGVTCRRCGEPMICDECGANWVMSA